MCKVKLKDVCTFYSGCGFPSQYQGSNYGQYPFFKVGDIAKNATSGNIYLEYCDNYIDEDVLKKIKGNVVPKNTVVFAKIGEALKLNRRAITATDSLIDNNCMGITPNPNYLCLEYFFYLMKSINMQNYSESTTVPSVRKSRLENIEIDLLDLATQNEISKLLDKLIKILDKKKQQISLLDELIKSRFVEMMNDSKSIVRLDSLITKYTAQKCGDLELPVLSITRWNGLMLQSDRFNKEIASKDKSQYKIVPRNKLVVAFPIDEGLLSAQTIVDNGIVSPAYNLYSIDESKIFPVVLEYILRSDLSIQYYLSK